MEAFRVLQVCPYIDDRAGGPPVLIKAYLNEMTHSGISAALLSTNWYSSLSARQLQAALKFPATIVESLPILGVAPFPATFQLIKAAVRDADIVHVHGLWHPLNWIAQRTAYELGIPVVLSPHGMLDGFPMRQKAFRKKMTLRLMEQTHLDRASCVLATSEMEKHSIARYTNNCVKVNALGAAHPPLQDELMEQVARLQRRFPALQTGRRIVFFGRLDHKKGVDRLLNLFARLRKEQPDLQLLVIGDGEQSYRQHLQQLVKALELEGAVIFTGFLNEQEKWGGLALADIFALPSQQENFGIAVVEAMNAGLPVVISKFVDLWPEIVAAQAGVAVDLDDDQGWLDAFSSLLADDDLRATCSVNGRRLVESRYSWQASTDRLLSVYRSCLEA